MPRSFNPTSAGFNVERVRAAMLADVALPKDFLQRGIDTVYRKLEAKKTNFFSFQGQVIEKVDIEDHATQLAAADKILAMSGLYVKERDVASAAPTIALEMDPRTGIVRLVVGTALENAEEVAPLLQLPADNVAPQEPSVDALEAGAREVEEPAEQHQEPQVVKVKQGNLPAEVFKALFGDNGHS